MKFSNFFSSISRRAHPPRPSPIIMSSKPLPPLPVPNNEEQAQPSSSTVPPLPPKPANKRRALLIGILNKAKPKASAPRKKGKNKANLVRRLTLQVSAAGSNELRGCHKDVQEMKRVLIEIYGYQESDIVVLIDSDDADPAKLPTEENILREMSTLVADAKAGDTFYLHFSGHSTQEPTDSIDEEDGMDEFLVTCDDKFIKDDILRDILVDPLPIGARLLTVFDSCHSASLLDLKHYRCNRVYVPWINKGRRRSHSKWNSVVRRQAQAPMSPLPMSPITSRFPLRGSRKVKRSNAQRIVESPAKSLSSTRKVVERRPKVHLGGDGEPRTPLSFVTRNKALPPLKTDSGYWLQGLVEDAPIPRCGSPEGMFCEGWCEPEENAHLQYPDVISLSAANDGERAWEDAKGTSMTQSLVAILRRNPNPTLQELLLSVSHDLHHLYIGIHAKSRDYKKKARMANVARIAKGLLTKVPASVEMDNFQNPQISSLYPLDTKAKRWAP